MIIYCFFDHRDHNYGKKSLVVEGVLTNNSVEYTFPAEILDKYWETVKLLKEIIRNIR